MIGGSSATALERLLLGPLISATGNQKLKILIHRPNRDLVFMNELFTTGKVKPVIDRRYTLSEVAEALRYLEEGHAQGKVVITM